ncbi:uncharacterized protein LOC128555561 [Mercenaria mercenaria]|uniref:uncharacterized protein LOC128555561 n=1 Tax=Mercenaria mercenaria TaxID=6596 RepID=UPI00234F869F|nr:uncharacterized protein LOC128555561 [Mercenaria mercenaria]
MKITCVLVILLSSCFWSADSNEWLADSDESRPHTLEVRGNYDFTTGYGRLGGRYTYSWDDPGSFYMGGSIDTNADWRLEFGFEFEIRKKSVQWHYNITLRVDPCNFHTYDDNRDGAIVKEELHAIFGNHEKTDDLFKDLDITTGDGYIAKEEFYAMAPVIIAECLDTAEK